MLSARNLSRREVLIGAGAVLAGTLSVGTLPWACLNVTGVHTRGLSGWTTVCPLFWCTGSAAGRARASAYDGTASQIPLAVWDIQLD
jgi:hypothetical protein